MNPIINDYVKKEWILNGFDDYAVVVNHFIESEKQHIFNEIKYFKLHSKNSYDKYIQLVRLSDRKVYANFVCYKDDSSSYLSPLRGTYGGVSGLMNLDFEILDCFIIEVLNFLFEDSHSVVIKLAPSIHNEVNFALTLNMFLRYGFKVTAYELNYAIKVTSLKFIDFIDYGNKKRINKCIRNDFCASIVTTDRYAEIYEVISENRRRKDNPLTLSFPDFLKMNDSFGERIKCFAVFSDGTKKNMIASSVCIMLSKEILYVFYWGDSFGYSSFSPVTFLASYIYEYAQNNAINIIDVGTSTVNGEPNFGLIRFKRNLGFTESVKLTLECKKELI